MKRRNIFIIGGASALILLGLLLGAFFAGPLLASANSSQAAAASAQGTNPYCEQYLQDLAHRLNVSVSTLEQDKLAAHEDVLNQLVKDGKLTQSQADAIKQRMQNSKECSGKGDMRWDHAMLGHFLAKYRSDIANEVAKGLNMSTDQLVSQLKAGKSLSQVAAAQHVSESQVHTIVNNAVQDALKKAVTAGDLTQTQANGFTQILQKHSAVMDHLLNRHFGKKAA